MSSVLTMRQSNSILLLMAGTVRALTVIFPTSILVNPSVRSGVRTLHYLKHNEMLMLRSTSWDFTVRGTSASKPRAMVSTSSEGSLRNEDCTKLEIWKQGGGLFHVSADIDLTAFIEPGAIVHAHAKVGPNVRLGSGTIVGPSVSIGSSTRIGYNVSLQNCSIGDFCLIHNGVCIGQDGFGHFVDELGVMVKKPQLLYARIGNHVEIGANTCVDRGSWRDTTIGNHTKIDNLVQIGHNVVIGQCCMICGQAGIAGSATLGDYVVMGGRSGVKDHVSVASKVRLAASSIVITNIADPGDYAGFPAVPAYKWRKSVIAFRRLSKHNNL